MIKKIKKIVRESIEGFSYGANTANTRKTLRWLVRKGLTRNGLSRDEYLMTCNNKTNKELIDSNEVLLQIFYKKNKQFMCLDCVIKPAKMI